MSIDRDSASRLGITPQTIDDTLYDAFGQRQVSTIFTQLNQYHVVLEVEPRFPAEPGAIWSRSMCAPRTARRCRCSAFAHFETHERAAVDQSSGAVPGGDVSFNLAPGASLGEAVDAIHAAEQQIGIPPSIQASFQGTAQAFQNSLANEPLLILAALVTVYIVLGVLYESYIHPITILPRCLRPAWARSWRCCSAATI